MQIIRKSVGELSEDTLSLQAYLSNKAPGSLLSYEEIEEGSGVTMNNEGRARLRSALNSLKREYSVIRGEGIRLADHHTAIQIVGTRFRKIDSAVKRADKTHRRIQEQFLPDMSPQEQRQMLFAGAVFGAIRLAAEQGRNIRKNQVIPTQTEVSIPLPMLG